MQVQSSTARTVAANDGYLVPATADTSTDLNLLPICQAVYHRMNGGKVSRATLALVMGAMADSSAVVTLYIGADGKQDARVLWPNSITLTKEHQIVARCYCTMRREVRSFRIDRMLTCHELTTPDDMAWEPSQDFEESPAAWGSSYRA